MNAFFRIILKWPVLILGLTLLISAAFFLQLAAKSRMETDLDKYMPEDHPAFIYSDQAEEQFSIKDGIIIAVEHPEGIYNSGTLQKVIQLTEALQEMEEIEEDDYSGPQKLDNLLR